MQILFPLTVKIIYDKESSDAPYVAYNPEFDVASCGPTEEKARQNLQEVVKIVLEEAKKKGKLEELLKEMGFQGDLSDRWLFPNIKKFPNLLF